MKGCSLLAGLIVLASCSSQHFQRAPASPLEVRYRTWTRGGRRLAATHTPAVTTSVYRGLLAKSMYSECRMVPHDSEFFDQMVKRCGGLEAVFRGAARLLLERSASTEFLVPVRFQGKLRWMDLVEDSPCD